MLKYYYDLAYVLKMGCHQNFAVAVVAVGADVAVAVVCCPLLLLMS